MTKKHFNAIAQDISYQVKRLNERKYLSDAERETALRVLYDLASDLASSFRGFNPNFNSAMFMHAAGVSY